VKNSKKAQRIIQLLTKMYPDAPKTYLNYNNPFEMLIATILSARAPDAAVNMVTPVLFRRYPTPEKLSKAELEDIRKIIRPCGAHLKKSQYIKETAKLLVENFSGQVPKSLEELITLKGVARKSANVILSVVFNIAEGVIVDTHIHRVTNRLGLSEEKTPPKIEKDLMRILPRKDWNDYARLIGAHGRQTCKPRRPKCEMCLLSKICPSVELL
jgi:endonuclease-3